MTIVKKSLVVTCQRAARIIEQINRGLTGLQGKLRQVLNVIDLGKHPVRVQPVVSEFERTSALSISLSI